MAATIIIDNHVLGLITDAERAVLSTMKGSEVPKDILADMVSQETMSVLFPNAQEGTMTETTETATTLTYMGVEFETATKMDSAFNGKTITSEDFGSLSKGMLLTLLTWADTHIGAQDSLLAQESLYRQQALNQARCDAAKRPAKSKQLMELKRAFNDYLSNRQKVWLRTKNRYQNIKFRELEDGRYQVFFRDFTPASQKVLADILQKMALMKEWTCKVQNSGEGVKHVYINMLR